MITRWWQFGLVGGIVLSLATLIKVIRAIVRGVADETALTEFGNFAAAFFVMGFVCGVVVWAGRGLSRRLGAIGDAVVGLVVMQVFFVSCMLLFEPAMLGQKFEHGGRPMLLFAVPLGLFAEWHIGQAIRRPQTEEQPQRRRFFEDDRYDI